MASDAEKALVDIACEFGRSYGEEVTEDVREEVLAYFDRTVRKGIEEFGVVWEEPVRAFVLKHVAKIGRKFAQRENPAAQASDNLTVLEEIADDTIASAREACTIRASRTPQAIELGPLC
jgi:hypothetical protein